jgi:hypothetical protein
MLLIACGYGLVLCPCEHGNEPIGFIEGGESLVRLSNYQVLKRVAV